MLQLDTEGGPLLNCELPVHFPGSRTYFGVRPAYQLFQTQNSLVIEIGCSHETAMVLIQTPAKTIKGHPIAPANKILADSDQRKGFHPAFAITPHRYTPEK